MIIQGLRTVPEELLPFSIYSSAKDVKENLQYPCECKKALKKHCCAILRGTLRLGYTPPPFPFPSPHFPFFGTHGCSERPKFLGAF